MKRLGERLFRWRETVVMFSKTCEQNVPDPADPSIFIFDSSNKLPDHLRKEFTKLRGLGMWIFTWFRMKFRGSRFLCLIEGNRICAYGWAEVSSPFLRRYRWLIPSAFLLGPFWTAPDQRGRGLYGRLLSKCLAINPDPAKLPVFIHADATNTSSLRGIEKAGFQKLGTFEVTSYLMGLWCTHKAVSQAGTVCPTDSR